MSKAKYFFYSLLCVFSTNLHAESVCVEWFKKSAITENNQCVIKCASLSVDMGTFDCPSQCESLCKTQARKPPLFNYPKGLTKGDREMIAKYPTDALKVYQAKQKADDLNLKVFKTQGRNDESDAFRHFVWAALITNELGQKKPMNF